ncbi:MAG TPA: SDR family oxidoreductase [Burkholderiales bacterium]|nr:SDR family oxidoreductase [Burkholderiales bacterium]
MAYFVTGATGFIGKRLVKKLLDRDNGPVYFLILESEKERLAPLYQRWGVGPERAIPVVGDITRPKLGIADKDLKKLKGKVEHLFHLAAVYDLKASEEAQIAANVEGTRRVIEFAGLIEAGCFHHTSSIAAAGLYEGTFREDMFEEAENLDHPYFRTKHDSEAIVRRECQRPWRVYRPGIVVGQSDTGEMDKVDGPYYFFKPIQRLRNLLPKWMPAIGLEGGRLNLVPVDFVVSAMDHLAHRPGLDGRCFHLTDPEPKRVGDILNIFAKAGHAPDLAIRINPHMFGFIPQALRQGLAMLTPVRRIQHVIMRDLGLPPDVMQFVNYPTRFDSRDTRKLLDEAGIKVPPLEDYAWKLWDYWERHLDPDLFIDRTLAGTVRGKVVMITGSADGIGRATALKVAEAGGKVIVVDRDQDKLDRMQREVAERGWSVYFYQADLTDYDHIDELVSKVLEEHGAVNVLVNNAGHSIRRGIENSFDRFHDYERVMRLNYFGALRLTMRLLPAMQQKRKGHVINISSIGVLTNAPRFSAYVASKAAMDAFTRCAASEFADAGIEFTTINMPLVKTNMTAPTEIYKQIPMLAPEEAADLVAQAIVYRPVRIATRLGIFAEVLHMLAPRISQVVMNTAYRMFPESKAAMKQQGAPEAPAAGAPTPDQMAFAQIMKGIHL